MRALLVASALLLQLSGPFSIPALVAAKEFGSHPPQGGDPTRDVPTTFEPPPEVEEMYEAEEQAAAGKGAGGKKERAKRGTNANVKETAANPLNEGPTAEFLTPKRNVALSCSVCELAFKDWKKRIEALRKQDPARDEISTKIQDELTAGCRHLRDTHTIRWGEERDVPDELFYRPKKQISIIDEGGDSQEEWAEQFFEHRCFWLRDKYAVELGVAFAEQKMPNGKCPITDCTAEVSRQTHIDDEL